MDEQPQPVKFSEVSKRIARAVLKEWWPAPDAQTVRAVEESIAEIVDRELERSRHE